MKILVVEDEESVSTLIKKGLEEEGYAVTQAFDAESGLALKNEGAYDILIFDIILPKMSGLELLKIVRETDTETPILMLTALGATDDVVTGLDTGADDYLVKPFKIMELWARLRALGRRGQGSSNQAVWAVADLEMNLESKQVRRAETDIKLTAREFKLLEYLIKNKGKVVSRTDILENVWEVNFDMGTNVIDVYVNYLRNKIDKAFDSKLIQTVIGMGYVLREP